MKVPPELLTYLKQEDDFFITTHINPEPDALGLVLALSSALESLGKKSVLYVRDPVPEMYHFIPSHEKFTSSIFPDDLKRKPMILLDCNTLERAGLKDVQFKSSAVIDHHETEKEFGDIRWIVPQAAATGIMVFYLLKEMGITLSNELATTLYSAIAIDTGTFRYSNTTAEVLRVGAELIEAGAEPASIATNLYEIWSEKRFRLFILALNTLEIRDDVAIIFVTKEMFNQTGTGPIDTEMFVSFPRMMKDVKVSALFRQDDTDFWKVSLRSRGAMNVARIATQFKGGGHRNAAGYQIKADLATAKEKLLKIISQNFPS